LAVIPEPRQTLRELIAGPGYAVHVLEIIARVSTAESPTDALELLQLATSAMGAEQSVFVSYIHGEDSHESYRFMLAADPRWCFEYQARAWYASDPWLLYSSLNSEAICASKIEPVTQQQRNVQLLAEKYGMVSVCIAPAASAGANARVGMLAIGSRQRGFFEAEGFDVFKVLARSLALELHEWWNRHERNGLVNTLRITDEELRLLRLELSGRGTKKVSGEIGLSTASIDSRWQRLNVKLGSPNRQTTARIAAKYGLI
jgi:DNA-binding CsgD family transcriptional regulator